MGSSDLEVRHRAEVIRRSESVETAVHAGELPKLASLTLAEALLLGLYNQGVRRYLVVFGHSSTFLTNILRSYEEAGLVKSYNVRSEIEASHYATALRRGAATVFHPSRPGPFSFLLLLNMQPEATQECNLLELGGGARGCIRLFDHRRIGL